MVFVFGDKGQDDQKDDNEGGKEVDGDVAAGHGEAPGLICVVLREENGVEGDERPKQGEQAAAQGSEGDAEHYDREKDGIWHMSLNDECNEGEKQENRENDGKNSQQGYQQGNTKAAPVVAVANVVVCPPERGRCEHCSKTGAVEVAAVDGGQQREQRQGPGAGDPE